MQEQDNQKPVVDGDKAFDEEVFGPTIEEMALPVVETKDEDGRSMFDS